MFKLTGLIFILLILAGCTSLRSVPYPTHFESLDEKAVHFIREVPPVDLKNLSSQGTRKFQEMQSREVMLSISGGGARAAAFSLGILAELENLGRWIDRPKPLNALIEVDYFSTVSGGGWGASAYLADRIQSESFTYSLNERLPTIKQKFLNFSKENDSCLARGIEKHITTGVKFSEINADNGKEPELPYLFINSTIETNQSPFIFSAEHIEYYHVDKFYACGDDMTYDVTSGLENLPLSFAVATRSSVPAFHHSSASTSICCTKSRYRDSFFCSHGKTNLSKLVLIDGGLYDNYGFKNALEILNSAPKGNRKILIVIDSNADTEIPFTDKRQRSKIFVGYSSLKKAGFPGKTTSFNRLFKVTAEAMNVTPLALDFFSAALTEDELSKVQEKGLLCGLILLETHALNNTNCFADDGTYLNSKTQRKDKWSDDCMLNNYYRSGLIGKTTYMFDDYYFTLLEQLGRFVVRLNAQQIYEAIYK